MLPYLRFEIRNLILKVVERYVFARVTNLEIELAMVGVEPMISSPVGENVCIEQKANAFTLNL